MRDITKDGAVRPTSSKIYKEQRRVKKNLRNIAKITILTGSTRGRKDLYKTIIRSKDPDETREERNGIKEDMEPRIVSFLRGKLPPGLEERAAARESSELLSRRRSVNVARSWTHARGSFQREGGLAQGWLRDRTLCCPKRATST